MNNIMAVVVTYNRKALLVECLDSLLCQSVPLNRIIIIDNNSTDGTYSFIKEKMILADKKIEYIRLSRNTGGAGGFFAGMVKSYEEKARYVWIMDDDVVPKVDALEKLVNGLEKDPTTSFVASTVIGTDGRPMNVPEIDNRCPKDGYTDWAKFLENKMVKIRTATFVSLLIKWTAIEKCGFPISGYFIWGDDTEYTKRLTTFFGPAYLVGDSVCIHKRVGGKPLSLTRETNVNRLNMYYYYVRNNVIISKLYDSKMRYVKFIITFLVRTLSEMCKKECKKHRMRKMKILFMGMIDAILGRFDKKEVYNRMNVEYILKNYKIIENTITKLN